MFGVWEVNVKMLTTGYWNVPQHGSRADPRHASSRADGSRRSQGSEPGQKKRQRDLPGGSVVRARAFTAGGYGLIPGPGIKIWLAAKAQHSQKGKKKKKNQTHMENARVCSIFVKNGGKPLPNTCSKCLFDYFAFLPRNIKIMHGHWLTCSQRAPVKVTTICTHAIELFDLNGQNGDK